MWVLIQESHLHVRKTDCRENKCGRVTRQARERLRTSAALVGTVKATGRSHPAFGVTGPAATKSAVANVVRILSDSVSGKLKAYLIRLQAEPRDGAGASFAREPASGSEPGTL